MYPGSGCVLCGLKKLKFIFRKVGKHDLEIDMDY